MYTFVLLLLVPSVEAARVEVAYLMPQFGSARGQFLSSDVSFAQST
jgi:hypothetical protein